MTEIGLKSWHVLGCEIFGTGVIELDFHWVGTTEYDNDKLNMNAVGTDMSGAAMRSNQDGILSSPVAVCPTLSSNRNTRCSEKYSDKKRFAFI